MKTFTLNTGEKIEVGNYFKIESGQNPGYGITLKDSNGVNIQTLSDGRTSQDIRNEIFYNKSIAGTI
jgi:hypothetical protein